MSTGPALLSIAALVRLPCGPPILIHAPMRRLLLFSARPVRPPLQLTRPDAGPPAPLLRVRHSSTTPLQPNIAALLAQSPPAASAVANPLLRSDGIIRVNGFVRTVRKQKRVAFAAIGDGSSLQSLQAVLRPEQAEGLSTGVAVSITGRWKEAPPGTEQSHEIHAENVRILGQNDATTYPLQKKYHSTEFLRTLPHLRPRLPSNSLLLRLRSHVIAQLTHFFSEQDFVQTHPPIITSSDCEGAGEVFTVSVGSASSKANEDASSSREGHFFQSAKYLTVSSQLHLEALAQSVGKVWALSPTFRAEKSDTPRHLSEFYMLEAELAFVEDLGQVMDLVENMLRNIGQVLQASRVGQELLQARKSQSYEDAEGSDVTHEVLAKRWQGLVDGPWPRITFADAVKTLQQAIDNGKAQFEFEPSYKSGLQAEHEKFLAEAVGQGSPTFVTDYPRDLKPFYMAPSTDSSGATGAGTTGAGSTVACFDLLVPEICELVGGSMREHRLRQLLENMNAHGLRRALGSESNDPTTEGSLQWYIDLRKYGSVPHGGFGLGFDRLLCYLSGVSNIREIVGFPRWYGRCDC